VAQVVEHPPSKGEAPSSYIYIFQLTQKNAEKREKGTKAKGKEQIE
jgi:hypothetical protein